MDIIDTYDIGRWWDLAPYGERLDALSRGARQVLVTDRELGAFEDFYGAVQVLREEVGARAAAALLMRGWRGGWF